MKRTFAIPLVLLVAVACLAEAQAQLAPRARRRVPPRIMEGGFRAEEIPECGSLGEYDVREFHNDLSTYMQILDVECSPGGPWGPYLYLAEQRRSDPAHVSIERISFQGEAESFVLVGPDLRSLGLTFAPSGWREGDQVLIHLFPEGSPPATGPAEYAAYSPDGQRLAGGIQAPTGALGPAGIDPTGFFDHDLFWIIGRDLYRRDAAGGESVVASFLDVGEMRWGPGGEWGTDLYMAGQVIAPDGSVTAFPGSFGEFDWAEGPGFDGDMFDLVYEPSPPSIPAGRAWYNSVYRVKPDGSRTLFARITSRQMVACDGALWFVNRGCWVIRPVRESGQDPGRRMDTRRHAIEP